MTFYTCQEIHDDYTCEGWSVEKYEKKENLVADISTSILLYVLYKV